MAICNLNEITISGADGFPNANGVYTGGGPNYYSNDNGVILMHAMGGAFGPGWYIISAGDRYFSAQLPADCPTGRTFYGNESEGVEGSFVLGGSNEPMIGLREGSEHLRLRLLGNI